MVAPQEAGRDMRMALLALLALSRLDATTFYVTVAGLGGEPEYEQRFAAWAKEIDKALQGPDAKVETLSGAAATRAHIETVLGSIAREAKPSDALVVLLIGHGTFDGEDYKINLPGPDLTAANLAVFLAHIAAEKQLVINMTSASGASIAALRSPGRAVITATRSGTEKNATVFPRFFVEALSDPAVDTDKNDEVSAAEMFRYVEQKTRNFYETQKRLSTEHATMDNVGSFPLLRLASARTTDPAKRELLKTREDIEAKIDTLKLAKAAMTNDDYKRQLSALLIDLAKTQAELDK